MGSPGAARRLDDRALLDAGHARGHAHEHARLEHPLTSADLRDEVLQHLLGSRVVGDNALTHGPDRHDVAGRTTDHQPCLFTYSQDLLSHGRKRNNAGLTKDDTLALEKNYYICSPEVYSKLGD
jgi:hypothetical protein